MSVSQLINKIIIEWAYRVNDGMPNPKNEKHIQQLQEVLSEMGLSNIKNDLIKNLLGEAENKFKNPVLNKTVRYKNTSGEDAEGVVGDMLRLAKDHPGRIAAEKMLPPEGSEERDSLNKDLGGEGQPEKPEDEKGKEGEDKKAGEEEKMKQAQAMFDPKVDPAMAARLDTEKETQAKLAADKAAQDTIKQASDKANAEFKAKADNEKKRVELAKEKGFNDSLHAMSDNQLDNAIIDAEKKMHDAQKSGDDKAADKANIEYAQHKVEKEMRNASKGGDKEIADAAVGNFLARKKDYEKKYGESYEADIPYPDSDGSERTPSLSAYAGDSEIEKPKAEPEKAAEPETPKEEPKAEPEKAAEPETPKEDPKKSKNKKTTAREDYDEAEEKGPSKMFPGKVHLGGGYYGTDENEMPNEKIVNGKLIPISDIQKDFMKTTGLSVDQMGSIDAALKKQGVDIEKHINDQNWQEKLKKSALDYAKAVKDYEKTTGKSLNKKSQPKAAELKPNEKDPESKVKTFKGGTSGKEIKTIELEGGGFLFGTQHGDTKMADDIINQVKASVPKEKWKDIVFVGEGGATKNGELAFNDEMEYSAPKFKEMGAGVDTWDGDALDVHKPESDLYKSQEEQTGLSQAKIKAGNWASMIGQGEGTDTMSPNTFLDDEGKEFLQQSAKEAGFPEIENWDEPTEQDKDTLYRLSFPEDNGDKETGVNTVQVAFNKARDLNLIKKQKELAASGKIPVVMAGEGHADLVDTMMRDKKDEPAAKTGPEGGPDAEPPANEPDRPDTTPKDGEAETPAKPEAPKAGPPPMPKLPPKVEPKKGEEPKAAEPKAEPETPSAEKPKDKKEKEDIKDEEPGKEATSSSGKKIYSVGGGYYSDKPNGPAKYVRTENIVDLAFSGILIEETFALFEKTISATLANGEKITVQELPPRAVKKATQKARAAAQAKKAEKPAQQTQPAKGEEPKKKPDVVIPGKKPGTIVKKSDGKPDVVLPGKEKPKAKTPPPPPPAPPKKPAVPPPPPPKKSEKPPIGEPQGEYKPDPNLKPEKDKEGNVPNTDIPVENEEKPNPGFVRKVSTKMDDFYLDVLKEEGRAQEAVIEQMKKEGKLPEDFKAVNPRDMGFGFKHPALKDNPDVQKELADRIKKENKPPHWDLCKVSIPGTNKFCDDNIGIPREKMPQLGGKPKPGSMGDKKAKKIADQNVRKKMGLPEEGEIPSEKQKEYDDLFAREKTDHVNVEKEFEEYLASEGIKVSEPIAVPASSLKATQNELVGEQVVGMVAALEEDPNNPFITAPIMVTRDGYVIDGHHRWATVQAYNMKHCPPNGPKPCIEMKVRVVDEDIDTHIPRANKFADDYGIEKMSGKAKGEPSSPTSAPRPFLQKVKDKIKKLNQEEKEFFNNGYYKPGSDARRSIGDTIKDKAAGAWKAIKKGFKHEVEEFKTAGKGIGKFFKGEKLDEHETKALKGVAIKVVTTALVGAAFGGLAHGAAAFAKHVAIEFVPHVVGETILKGAGRAAVFADGDGDAEMEANLQKFMEMVADGVANMNISAKQMDSMLDSYNQKKEKEMKSESLIEELINEITLEANPIKKADDVLNQMIKYKDEKGGDHEVKVATALKYKNSPNTGQLQAYKAAVGLLKKAGVSGKELGDEKPQQIKGTGLGFRKTGEKNLKKPIKKAKKVTTTKKKEKETEPDFSKMKAAQLKKFVEDRIAKAEDEFDKSKNKAKYATDFMLKRQAEINNNYLRPAGSPASSLGENNGGKYINQIWKKGGKLSPKEEEAMLEEIMNTPLAQQIPPADRRRWARIALETAKTEVRVLLFQKKYNAAETQTPPYPMGVIMDKQSKAMLKKHFTEMMNNAKTQKERKHYQKQLDYIDKLSESDTGVMYERKDGTIGFKHTSNKSGYDDPHNNTSVDEKIKALQETLGDKLDPTLAQVMQDVSKKVKEASAGIEDACRKFAEGRNTMTPEERNAQDAIIAKVVSAFPVRGGGKKNYLDECKGKPWFNKKAEELGIKIPVKSEKDAVTIAIACAGDTPPPTAALKVLIKVSEMLEKVTPETAAKLAPAFNLKTQELLNLSNSASILKSAAKTRRDVMGEAHTELVNAIQKADEATTPPSYPFDENADNGPHQQAYVKDYLHRMHFTSYILGERDGVSSQNIGGDNVEPEFYRHCLAELSGYEGSLDTPEGRQGLVSHLEKRMRVSPKNDSIIFVNGETKAELGKEVYRTKGEAKSVVSGLGKDMQKCLKGKATNSKNIDAWRMNPKVVKK